ncbi:hypothetical protein BFL28_02610 [Sphingomonas turrisvirgatae]|uniref:Uncharacterized protein n=1 Tax=Sphingomonas turrisvirgatae TaxID=1888892 RepID=A0A1E3LTT0_9SPHN|nr:hypothetical protein BFL28_02610 [Sphingomonas turrisvirgatae]
MIGSPEFDWWKVYLVHSTNEAHLRSKANSLDERPGALRPACRVQQPFLAPPKCSIEPFLKARFGANR